MSSSPRITSVVCPVAYQILFAIAATKGESLSAVCGSIVNEWARRHGAEELAAWTELAALAPPADETLAEDSEE
jgi:hypothetical protein